MNCCFPRDFVPEDSNKVYRRNALLYLGNQPFYFASFNTPNLLMVEDRPGMKGTWIPTDPYEIDDALRTIAGAGGKVTRTYTLGIGPNLHITALRTYNETAFVAMDHALHQANIHCVKLIIPIINNHNGGDHHCDFSFGDYGLLAQFRHLPPSQFFVHPDLIEDYKHLLHFLLNRINTVSGIR